MGGGERRPSTAGGSEYESREPEDEADEYGESGEREADGEDGADGDDAAGGGGAGDGETTQQTLGAYGGGLPGGVNPVHGDTPGDTDVDEDGEGAGKAAAWWGLLGVVQGVSGIDDETMMDDVLIETLQRVHDETMEDE